MTDVELMQRVAKGDPAAQRALLERVLERVRTTVRYASWNHAEQADIVQSALVEVLRSAASFRGQASLETWTDRIAQHTSFHYVSRRRRADATTPAAEQLPEQGLIPPDERAREALKWKLGALLQRLHPDRRAVLIARYVQQYSVSEIAELVNAPVNTVRDRLRVGLGELRAAWSQTEHRLKELV